MIRRVGMLLAGVGLMAVCLPARAVVVEEKASSAEIDFNHDIRPILSNNCFLCHGPDHTDRKADLRLDMPDDATAPHKHGTPIVPGDLAKSELYQRVSASDPDQRMPPPDSGKKLTPRQIELFKQWIAQGAKYEKHWAYVPPKRSPLPAVNDQKWCRNPIDRFILARLEAEGLKPSPEADRTTLVRRLYLDLLGLPPTPAQVKAFVLDNRPDAYERLVDQLLANPHYGERMALDWLDAARYADTHGYHIDSGRDQTAWREWVINAFNRNMPFDQFTIDQLAGDLLPHPTVQQRIATGFVRNNMVNFEGGAIPEEYLTAYVLDRTNTVSTVWLGLTLNCCQCHDHKFDPFTQKDYYRLYAYFNHVPENGLDGDKGNAAPFIATPTMEQQRNLDQLAASIKQVERQLAAPMAEVDAAQAKWEQTIASDLPTQWAVLRPDELKSEGGATLKRVAGGAIVASGTNPSSDTYTITAHTDRRNLTAIRLETLPDRALRARGPGRSDNGNFVLTGVSVRANSSDSAENAQPIKLKAVTADFSQDEFPISNLLAGKSDKGWAIYPQVGKAHSAIFQFEHPIANETGTDLTIALEFKSPFANHQAGRIRLSVTDSKHPLETDTVPANVRQIAMIGPDQRTDAQRATLREWYRRHVSDSTKELAAKLDHLESQYTDAQKHVRTTMVMEEMAKPRDTFILVRGQYDQHGERVTPAVPLSLAPQPKDAPPNRLGLAEWLVSPENPLPARVTINRLWQTFFGIGIVKTTGDFGSQGEEPSHPELLDWLAVEFMDPQTPGAHRWDVNAMVRLIVTSATYRQSSAVSPELLARDPENRLLARGARFRLPAEFIRDDALAVSGLLNPEIGGRSVFPYQPKGLWEELMSRSDGAKWTAQVYVQDHGPDLYRRTMYTFWKRTSPPPTLSTFDAPDRETCTVRRARTNTPLQALVLMNDPTYVEASRKLAERMMTEVGGDDPAARITFAFRLATARAPNARETQVLRRIYDRQLAVYRKDPNAADRLLHEGESPTNAKLDKPDLAAWTMVANTILNLDETITKG